MCAKMDNMGKLFPSSGGTSRHGFCFR